MRHWVEGTVSLPFGFAGEYRDAESGMIHLRARYYDPATGQFISVDPAFTQTASRYAYVAGNPLNAVDPAAWTTSLKGNRRGTIRATETPGG